MEVPESKKLTKMRYSYNIEENNHARRIKAGHSDFQEDDTNANLYSNADQENDQSKRKRKKRLKPLTSDFVSILKGKEDKYGITAAYTAMKTKRKKTADLKGVRPLQERLQNKIPDTNPDPSKAPRTTLKMKRNTQVFTSNILKLPPVSDSEQQPKKVKAKRESRAKAASKVNSLNDNKLKKLRTSFNDNFERKSMYVMQTQRSGITIRGASPSPSPYPSPNRSRSRSQKRSKSLNSVSFEAQNQSYNNNMLTSEENIGNDSDSMQPNFSDIEESTTPKSRSSLSQILINKINASASSQKLKKKLGSITSLISAKKSTSSTSGFQTKNGKQSRPASPIPDEKMEENVSRTSSHRKSRAPRPPSPPPALPVSPAASSSQHHIPKRESISSIRKRKSFKKRIKPKQILLSLFRQPEKNTAKPAKSNLNTDDTTPQPREKKEIKITIKENEKHGTENNKHATENEKHGTEEKEHASTSGKKPVLKSRSEHTLKSSSSTRVNEEQPRKTELTRTVRYKTEANNFFKPDFQKFKRQFMEQLTGKKSGSPQVPNKEPPRAHGFMRNFLKTAVRTKDKPKENYPSPLTDQVRVHAFRRAVFNIVARLANKEKTLHQKLKSIAPPPYPRVHGFTQPVLAIFKCGRLKEKEEEIERQRLKFKKKSKRKKTVDSSQSKIITVQSTETVSGSKHTMNTSETKIVKKSKSVKKGKKTKKITENEDVNENDDDSDDDDDEELEDGTKITEIITITTIKTKSEPEPNCPYVIETEGKNPEKRCCCQFLKSLPPTPRETFRKNPGFPHFYPAPGFRHRWGYELKLRRLKRLEEERQRLCAEQRGLPYNGPPRQYQDFFDDTPMEERCCCDDHRKGRKKKGSHPDDFECNKADPHLAPTVAAFKHFFEIRGRLKEKDNELAKFRKQCEETFPEIAPLIDKKKKKLCDCRGAILSAEEDREEKIKEIVGKMAAICTCLDDCDCKAALQAKEPHINVDDELEACCCSRLPQLDEDFDCNAGDPHKQPTVAAFKHGFDYGRRKRERIAKRKSIYDEIVQHGTEEEIKEARISLLKQIAEDGTKEEQEEARDSLEETKIVIETEIKRPEECDCPEIQEIVVMIEDSDCDEPMYTPYAPEYEICEYGPMSDPFGNYMIPEFQEEMEGWKTDPYVELPEVIQENEVMETQGESIVLLGAKPLQTQTPSGQHLLIQDSQNTTETQTPRTSQTQTENTLQTQTPLTTKTSGNVDKDRDSKANQNRTSSETSETDLKLMKSTEDIKAKEDATAVKSEDSTSKKNKFTLKNLIKTKEDATSVKSEDSTSKKKKDMKTKEDATSVKSEDTTSKKKKDIKAKEDATSVKSENSTSKKNKFSLKNLIKTKDEATSVKSEDSTSKKKKDIKTKEDATSVKSEDSTSKKKKDIKTKEKSEDSTSNKKKDIKTKEDATSVISEDSTSKKNKMTLKENIAKGLKDLAAKKSTEAQSIQSDEVKTKTVSDKDSEHYSERQTTSAHAEGKKRRKKSKCTEKARKLSKADQFMYRCFQPPKCVIKPRCVCLTEKKTKIKKETDCEKQIPKRSNRTEKCIPRKCECCCNCEETKTPIRNKKPQRASQEKRESDRISEKMEKGNDASETGEESQECKCTCNCKNIRKSCTEKLKSKSKCKENHIRCDCILKSLRQPKGYSLDAGKCKRKSSRPSVKENNENTIADTWVPEEEIYYQPPDPEPQYPKFCQPANCMYYNNSSGLPEKEIFNFPPPNFSSIYQEYPQNNICTDTDMVFSVQFEQDRSSSGYVPINFQQNAGFQNFNQMPVVESQASFRVIFTDEDEEIPCSSETQSDSSSSLSSDDKKNLRIPGRCKKQAEKISCRCKKPPEKVPCRYNNRGEKIPCRC